MSSKIISLSGRALGDAIIGSVNTLNVALDVVAPLGQLASFVGLGPLHGAGDGALNALSNSALQVASQFGGDLPTQGLTHQQDEAAAGLYSKSAFLNPNDFKAQYTPPKFF